MKIIRIDLNDDFNEAIQEAVTVLKMGGTIVYPTDTLYGLGANALDIYAVEKIFKIKQRLKTKPLPIIIRNLNWAKELAHIYQREEKILSAVWPGPVSVILSKRNIIPNILTANRPSVSMRVPKSGLIDWLLGKFGYPIVATSANISGGLPSNKISEIIERFGRLEYKPDLVIDAGDLKESEPSTILDLASSKPKILRIGLTKPEKLLKLLEI